MAEEMELNESAPAKRGYKSKKQEEQKEEQVFPTKMYQKYALRVEADIVKKQTVGFTARIVEKLREHGLTSTCNCSEAQAEKINRSWHNSRVILWPMDKEPFTNVYRSLNDDGTFTDTFN